MLTLLNISEIFSMIQRLDSYSLLSMSEKIVVFTDSIIWFTDQ